MWYASFFSLWTENLEKKEKEKDHHAVVFLSMQWGYVVVTTPEGVLDHEEAIKRNVGGQVLGYFH